MKIIRIIVAFLVLSGIWVYDLSGMRKWCLVKFHDSEVLEEYEKEFCEDRLIEFYKTSCYLLLWWNWFGFYSQNARKLMEMITILLPVLALVHSILVGERFHLNIKGRELSTVHRMFLTTGFIYICKYKKYISFQWLICVYIGVGLIIFGILYSLKKEPGKYNGYNILEYFMVICLFLCSAVFLINFDVGEHTVVRYRTIVERLSTTGTVTIPENDAIHGKDYFKFDSSDILDHSVGDRVQIDELTGCLGIHVYIVEWEWD